ncbi:Nn.00g054020.m01.CDS01 [Neocucurbitaria sp. VM-36]
MSPKEDTNDKLAALNSAAMGTSMPVVTLPDGQKVQTGTVGALIINIKLYDELLRRSDADNERKVELKNMMAASLPVLKRTSMFSLFTPEEWIQGTSPGRRYVGELALQSGHA